MTRHRCFFILRYSFLRSQILLSGYFVSKSRCEGDVIGSGTVMAGFLFNDEILEDPVGPAWARRRRRVFRPRVSLELPAPELHRQAMHHVHVLIDKVDI